jgi:hypothetical protein
MSKSRKRKLAQCQYLGGKCVVSGSKVEDDLDRWGTLRHYDNHHINPDLKADDYDNLIRREICSGKALEELSKCVLVKSDYHDIIESQKVKGAIKLPSGIEIPIRSGIIDPKQEFGWAGKFFLDRTDLKRLVPRRFLVVTGKTETVMNENEIGDQFFDSIRSLSPGEHYQVRNGDLVLLDIEKRDKENIVVTLDGLFDLFSWKLESEGNTYYIRDGKMVDKNWNILRSNGDWNLTIELRLGCLPQTSTSETANDNVSG